MTDRQAEKLIKLAKELSAIIYKYERLLKPSEADKARQVNKFLNQTCTVVDCWGVFYKLDIDGRKFDWYEEELEPVQPTLFDRIKSSILEAAKQAPVIVEQTEDGGIKISPIEDKNDDLPIDTPCMCSGKHDEGLWFLRYYSHKGRVFTEGRKFKNNKGAITMEYIIPFDKFNPNDIEESLKYNIVK